MQRNTFSQKFSECTNILDKIIRKYASYSSTAAVVCIQCYRIWFVNKNHIKPTKKIYIHKTLNIPLFYEVNAVFGLGTDGIRLRRSLVDEFLQLAKLAALMADIDERGKFFPSINISGVDGCVDDHKCIIPDKKVDSPLFVDRNYYQEKYTSLKIGALRLFVKANLERTAVTPAQAEEIQPSISNQLENQEVHQIHELAGKLRKEQEILPARPITPKDLFSAAPKEDQEDPIVFDDPFKDWKD